MGKNTNTIIECKTTIGSFQIELYDDQMPLTVGNILDLIKNHKYYDGLYIHRIVPGYCIQFGCPYAKNPYLSFTEEGYMRGLQLGQLQGELDEDGNPEDGYEPGNGSGPPDTTFVATNGKEYTRDEYGCIEDEFLKTAKISNLKYTVAMANSSPEQDTGGSQFFINLSDDNDKKLDWFNVGSDSAHPVFGQIVDVKESRDFIDTLEQVELHAEQPVEPIQMISVTIVE